MILAPVLLCAAARVSGPARAEAAIDVDCSRVVGAISPDFWNSTGLDQGAMTPAFDEDMQFAGSVPCGGWMRPHDLLYLVRATGLGTDHPAYDWSRLDHTLDVIRAAGLKPLFELMGNPSRYFTDFRDMAQVRAWKRLVADLAVHLEGRYGRREVRSWLFESWNEPDIDGGWKWRGPDEHHHYYDACSEGLKAADPALRFGGPGLSRRTMPYGAFFRSFLDHCDAGVNCLTGERGVRLDFISIHRKDKPAAMVRVEIENIESILRDHPRFGNLLLLNDEADSEVGWSKRYPYRATPWYAAFIARSVNEHLVRIADGAGIPGGRRFRYRMSNDDAFWGVWENRTQLVRFGDDRRFAFVKKPSHLARTALALLGDERCLSTGWSLSDGVGAIATRRGDSQVAVLVYNYSDATGAASTSRVRLRIAHLPFAAGLWAQYRIDMAHGDTHRLWEAMGSPARPSKEQLARLRRGQELELCGPLAAFSGPELVREFDLPLPGVSLVLLSADPGSPPGRVEGVRAETYLSLYPDCEETMITWTPASRFVRTYEVLCAPAPSGPFRRVNAADQIETGFAYLRARGRPEWAAVRAVDFWGRVSEASAPIELPPEPPIRP